MEKGYHSYNYKYKVITSVLAFAFFWLVIGDLIAIHQKLIYGFDPYGTHQPFSKPAKNESHFKVKDKKVVNKTLNYLSHGTALLPDYGNKFYHLSVFQKSFISAISIHRRRPILELFFRGPPVIF